MLQASKFLLVFFGKYPSLQHDQGFHQNLYYHLQVWFFVIALVKILYKKWHEKCRIYGLCKLRVNIKRVLCALYKLAAMISNTSSVPENQEVAQIFIKYMHDIVL